MDEELKKTEIELGIDEDGLYLEAGSQAAVDAFIRLLLVMTPEQIHENLERNAVKAVKANNKAAVGELLLKPLLNCPKRVYPDACAVCFWRDKVQDVCHGG